ncbi:MAG: hypothetical protein GZ094_02080 [Mariniphaga sp.]|nr:hypothetical protein [Mariniphaga sp.]
MEGWIKLHRIITEWEWYDDSNTFRLFIHLLLKANSKDAIWRGEPIKRGQMITSIAHLSEELKLSVKQIRISINKLKRTNEVTSARANNATRLTINKYDSYQAKPNEEGQTKRQREDKEGANEGQTKGDKQELKKEKNNVSVVFDAFRLSFPGTKRGLKTELEAFLKKNDSEIIFLLLPALEREKSHRAKLAELKEFVPPWKNLSTWIDRKCWEQEFETTPESQKPQSKTPKEWL